MLSVFVRNGTFMLVLFKQKINSFLIILIEKKYVMTTTSVIIRIVVI